MESCKDDRVARLDNKCCQPLPFPLTIKMSRTIREEKRTTTFNVAGMKWNHPQPHDYLDEQGGGEEDSDGDGEECVCQVIVERCTRLRQEGDDPMCNTGPIVLSLSFKWQRRSYKLALDQYSLPEVIATTKKKTPILASQHNTKVEIFYRFPLYGTKVREPNLVTDWMLIAVPTFLTV
jgi:hypothetical protein